MGLDSVDSVDSVARSIAILPKIAQLCGVKSELFGKTRWIDNSLCNGLDQLLSVSEVRMQKYWNKESQQGIERVSKSIFSYLVSDILKRILVR